MNKFTFNNSEKTEIRHNIVPEFLIEVIKLDYPNAYQDAGLSFADVFDEVFIRGWHFVFKVSDDFLFDEEDEEQIRLIRSICRRAGKWYKSQVVAGFIPLEKFVPAPGVMEDERFKIERFDDSKWITTDKTNLFSITFENKKFIETQEIKFFEDENPANFASYARYFREIGEWLSKNHAEKI